MNMLKRSLAMILTVCMLLGVLPFGALAEEFSLPEAKESAPAEETVTEAPAAAETEAAVAGGEAETVDAAVNYKILHLDCGRKYFTKDWIVALINEMAYAGYTHLELAFGNDGLRFLLDDMSVAANNTTYSDDAVTAAIQAGNTAYNNRNSYNPGSANELTQAEMDAIIAHANTKGIQIIPLLNNPGHMDAIVSAATTLTGADASYNGSVTTVDLENTAAVAFTKALVQKYITYFAGKGSTMFNIGADEYANDIYTSGAMGFGQLVSLNKYDLFVDYVNDLNAMVKAANMQTVAFNDGIYFQENTSAEFDTDIIVAFWTSGWGTGTGAYGAYKSASASTMAGKDHPMINVHGDYYYVLGKNDLWTPGTTATHDASLYTSAAGWDNTVFMGSTVSNPVGSMFCIWCDYPGAETETQIAANARLILRAMGAEMNEKDGASVSTEVIEGGFNADGTINATSTEPETPTVSAIPNAPATMTVGEVATLSLTESASWISSNDSIISVASVSRAVTGTEVQITANAEGKATITATADSGNTYTSDITVVAAEGGDTAIEGTDTVTSTGGGIAYELATSFTAGEEYVIVNTSSDGTGYALTNNSSSSAGTTNVTISNGKITSLTEANDDNVLWTISGTSNATVKNGSYYVYLGNNSQVLSTSSRNLAVNNRGNGAYRIYRSGNSTYYLRYNSGWQRSGNAGTVYLFQKVDATAYSVDAALQESRINAYTVTNDGYTDETWNAYQSALTAAQAKLAEVEGATYNSETAANAALTELIEAVDALEAAKNALAKAVTITINYVDENGTTVKTETKKVAENATSVTLTSPIYDAESNTYVLDDTTLELSLPGTTTYTVSVTYVEEDLTQVDPLTIEYWITNARLTGSTSNQDYITIEADDDGIYSENGVDISTLVDASASTGGRTQTYWQSKILDVELSNSSTSGTEHQTLRSGDDETLNGAAFTHVRYWNGAWQVKTASGWVSVDRTQVTVTNYDTEGADGTITRDKNQLVAYYMEVVDIQNANGTTELTVNTADWGKKGDGTAANDYLDPNSTVSVSIQIIYEDGSGNPANVTDTNYPTAEDLQSKTIVYGYWTEGRGLGTMVFTGGEQFEIYKVTAETGGHTVSGSTWEGVTVNSFTWDDNAKTVWEGDPTSSVSIGNPARSPSSEDPYDNLMWDENHEAILIRVYVKAVETEDSLTVVYYDEKFGDTLYSYNITVSPDHNFNNSMIGTTGTINNRLDVTGCGIENIYGVTQYFQTNLTLVPEAIGKYNNELYEYTGSEISDDGKTLYLYYNINTEALSPIFVADFGLPLTFELSDVVNKGIDTVKSVSVDGETRYGTLSYESATQTFTYTPTSILQNIDVLTVNILFDGDTDATTTNVGVVPATTVFYEEKFMFVEGQYSDSWDLSKASMGSGNQTTEVLGKHTYNYGYDPIYAASSHANGSNGSYAETTVVGAKTEFTFTGTGFDLYANCDEASAWVTILCQGEVVKMYMVDSKVAAGTTGATTGQTGPFYSLPLVSETGLTYGEYTVQIRMTQTTGQAGDGVTRHVQLDGIRIYDTIDPQYTAVYEDDLEDNPEFYELRDYVLNAINVTDTTTADQVYGEISTDSEAPVALITSAGQIYGEGATALDLLDNGPKNEVYLYAGDSLTFKVETSRAMQLGLKAPTGATNYSLSYEVDGATTKVKDEQALNTSVDMFYALGNTIGTATTYTITVTNTGDNILSVTDLKICDDPAAAFVPLTVEDIEHVLTGEHPQESMTADIKRIAGFDRFATSFAIADELKAQLGVEKFETVVVAFGGNFPDALTGSYLAAVKKAPILLVMDNMVDTLCAYLTENLQEGGKVYILGGEAVVSRDTETAIQNLGFTAQRLAGDDRVGTNLAILREAGVAPDQELLICTAFNYADSLSAAATGLPMLLVGQTLTGEQKAFLDGHSGKLTIIGGVNAVSEDIAAELGIAEEDRLAGSNRYETSVMLAERYFHNVDTVLLAYGRDFPDGLCGGALAACLDAPVILTETASYADADAYVENVANGYILGGALRIDDDAARDIFDLAEDAVIKE